MVDFYELNHFNVSQTKEFKGLHFDKLIGNSDNSVLLFFAISGFILGLPFAKSILFKTQPPKLFGYFVRRISRLEPPYILLLTALFILNVFVLNKASFSQMFPHFLASVFYLHNVVFEAHPYLNFVFWSLEIEIQFYLLAPLIVNVFRLNALWRRCVLLLGIVLFSVLNLNWNSSFLSLANYIQYFLAGLLALDLFLTAKANRNYIYDALATLIFMAFWTGIITEGLWLPIALTMFIYWVYLSRIWIKILSIKWLTVIGGMCYSIYMIHHPLMSFVLNRFFPETLLANSIWGDFVIRLLVSTTVVLVGSVIYFILIERPCMAKNWYKGIWRFKV